MSKKNKQEKAVEPVVSTPEVTDLPKVREVKIVDVKTGAEVTYDTIAMPKESTLGNCYFNTLNFKGIAKCQAAGINILDEPTSNEAMIRAFSTAFGIDLVLGEDIGNRGGNWSTPSERATTRVYVDNEEYCPTFSAAALKKAETIEANKVARAEAKALRLAEAPELATADTSMIEGKDVILAKIQAAIADGYSKKDIVNAVRVKDPTITLAQAHTLYKEVAPAPKGPLTLD